MAESSAIPGLPGLVLETVEWLPSGAGSGLVRVRGRWEPDTAPEPDLPALALRVEGTEHRFESLPDARFSRDPDSWRGTYLVAAELVATDPEALWGDPAKDAKTWADHNPYDLAANLQGTPVYLSVGDGQVGPLDPPGARPDSLEARLNAENVAFRERLAEFGVEATVDFYGPGTHTWPYWERALHQAWPMLSAALAGG